MTERFSVVTTKDKKDKLDEIAKDQKRSRNNLINIILDEYLENKAYNENVLKGNAL